MARRSKSRKASTGSTVTPRRVAEIMLSWLDLRLVSISELQTLWAGYGHICSITAKSAANSKQHHIILKLISPPSAQAGDDEGHLRKMFSYEVEQCFYNTVAPLFTDDAPMAKCLAATNGGTAQDARPGADELQGVTAMLLTDLRPEFPIDGSWRSKLTEAQVHTALLWLARFHSQSWGFRVPSCDTYVLPPIEEAERRQSKRGGSYLWLNGGYTYLATRRSELASLARDRSSEWRDIFCSSGPSGATLSEMVAEVLGPRGTPYESLIHGDVKSENLFTTQRSDRVAFFDFQYVGLGLGVCDVAKLCTCSMPMSMLTSYKYAELPKVLAMDERERALLEKYHEALITSKPKGQGPTSYDWALFVRHWETALVDWCRFQASWGFWGNSEWLESRVRHIVADAGWRAWLEQEP